MNAFVDHRKSNKTKNVMTYEQLIERINVMSEVVFPAIMDKTNAYVDNMKEKFDKYKNIIVSDFVKGTPVMVRIPTLKGSLTPSYMGPYTVVRKTKGGSYVLTDETGMLMDRDYTPSELKAISQSNILDEEDDGKVYEIEGILDHRGTGSNVEYKIRWKGYSQDEDSWLKPEMITHENTIQQYWRRKLGKDYKPYKNSKPLTFTEAIKTNKKGKMYEINKALEPIQDAASKDYAHNTVTRNKRKAVDKPNNLADNSTNKRSRSSRTKTN
jgi:hypothetical protein